MIPSFSFGRFIASVLVASLVATMSISSSHADTGAIQVTDTLDVDADGKVDALTDGILILRYLFGLRGQSLVQGALGPGATRTAPADIEAYLLGSSGLDVDNNAKVDALTDGILLIRYMFGLSGQPLIQGAIGSGATRTSAADVATYIGNLYTLPGNCAITASPSSSASSPVPPGTSVQLTANCAVGPGPFTFQWSTGVTGTSIMVNPQSTSTYTVTPSNNNGSGAQASTTVTVGTISSCSVSQSPNTQVGAVPVGSTVTLNVVCSGNSPSSCSWSNGINTTFCTVDIQAPFSTTTYTVTPNGGSGAGIPINTTVNVIPSAQGAQNFCTGGDSITYVGWPGNGQIKLGSNGFKNQRLAFQIVVPSTFNPPLDPTHVGFINVYEAPGSTTISREVTVSKNACDFQSGQYLFSNFGQGDTAPHINFSANNPNGYQQTGAILNVNSGDTVYVNIRNLNSGQSTCPYPSCDMILEFATPNRY